MKKLLSAGLIASSLFISNVFAYNADQAAMYENMFKEVTKDVLKTSPCFVKPETILEQVANNERFTIIDIRTTEELKFNRITLKGTLNIPLNKLFEAKNLDKIPTDRPVYILCHSGARATSANMALKTLGFENTQVVKGGWKDLTDLISYKTVPELEAIDAFNKSNKK